MTASASAITTATSVSFHSSLYYLYKYLVDFLFPLVIVDQSRPDDLFALPHHHPSRVVPLSVDLFEAPDLLRAPSGAVVFHVALDPGFGVFEPFGRGGAVFEDFGFEEFDVGGVEGTVGVAGEDLAFEGGEWGEVLGAAFDFAEDVVDVAAFLEVHVTDFSATWDATCEDLDDFYHVGLVFLVAVRGLSDVEGYGGDGDGFAFYPANTLEGEDRVGVVGQRFVLKGMCQLGWIKAKRKGD